MVDEEEDKKPAVKDGEVDCENKAETASLANQKPRPLSSPYHRCAGDAAPERAHLPKKEQEEITWTWKRQSWQGVIAGIGLSYHKKIFEDIRSVLTEVGGKKLLQQFLDGCFGHLMHFIGGYSCNRALHELISHEINLPGAREDELWFHVGGTNIQFSPAEYALVTGLCFGSSNFDPLGSHKIPPDGVCQRFCSGHPITIKELWKRFNLHRVRGSAEDYLKVAHILALYLMGLGYYYPGMVEQWAWVLVEDLDLWNRFPWGAYSYQALMHYVSMLARTRLHLGSTYRFPGPVWALQLVCHVTLEPTDEEKMQPYWVSVQTPQPLGVGYTIPMLSRPGVRSVVSSERQAEVSSSSDDASLEDTRSSLHELRRSSRRRHTPHLEAYSADPFVSGTDGRVRSTLTSSARRKFTISSGLSSWGRKGRQQHVHEVFDENNFADRVSGRVVDRLIEPVADRMTEKLIKPVTDKLTQTLIEPVADRVTEKLVKPAVERLTQQLTPQLKQWMEDLFRQEVRFLYATSPGCITKSAKAAEFAGEKQKKEKSFDGGSSSKKTENGPNMVEKKKPGKEVLKNAPRLDIGVAGWEKPFVNQKDCIQSQIDSNKFLKSELKLKARTSPPRGANITKKKKSRWSPSSSEETSDDESSSCEERRRKRKKRCRKKRPKYSDSSSSESDRHRRRRNRHKHRCSSSSDSDAGGSRRHHHRPHGQHRHHSVSLPD